MPHVDVIEGSPTTGIRLSGVAGEILEFNGEWWIRDGAVVERPASIQSVEPAWRKGGGMPAPRSVPTTKWTLPGKVCRAQKAGDAILVDVETDDEVRQLYWCDTGGVRCARWQLAWQARVEVVAPRLAVVFDPLERQVELVSADRPEVITIALPAVIAEDVVAEPGVERVLAVAGDRVIVCGRKRAYAITGLVEPGDAWTYRWSFPRGDATASARGVVTMSKWGRTNILVGERKLVFGATELVADERVELRALLWDVLGSAMYREIVRADGSVIACPGAPPASTPAEAVVRGTFVPMTGPVDIPLDMLAAVEVLRGEGFVGELTPEILQSFCDQLERLEVPLLLQAYYRNPRRAAEDHYTPAGYTVVDPARAARLRAAGIPVTGQ